MAYYGTGPIKVADGGTGSSSLTDTSVLVGNGTSAITVLAAGVDGELIAGRASADPLFSTIANGNFNFSTSAVAAAVTCTVENTSDTANSNAITYIETGGMSSGDPKNFWLISGSNSFATGIDNSASNRLVICSGTALGTTDRMRIETTGAVTWPANVAFLSFLPTDVTNVTGQSGTYALGAGTALTEVFDQGSAITTGGTFTAPVTGRYDLRVNFTVIGTTIANKFNAALVTENRTYISTYSRAASNANQSWYIDGICDMDAADIATFQLAVTGEAADTDDIDGASGTLVTFVSGTLVA
jgi:hypothetical protein